MSNRPASDISPPVICRPNASAWVMIVLLGVIAASALFADHLVDAGRAAAIGMTSGNPVLLTFAIALLTPAAALTYWMLHARFEATGDGLRWRHFGRWTSVRWDEITDYYLISTMEGKDIPAFQSYGRTYPILHFWARRETLLSEIEKRATKTSAEGWALLGCRAGAISTQKFIYDTPRHRLQIMLGRIIPILVICLLLLATPWDKIARTSQSIGVGWAIAEAGLPVAVVLPLTLLFVPILAPQREALRRAHHEIATNGDGIRFGDGERIINAAWSEVTTCKAVENGGRYRTVYGRRIETKDNAFEFTCAIRDYNRLCRILDHRIPEHACEKPCPGEGVIGGEESLWTGGSRGDGDRVFHYRTTIARGLMLVYGLLVLGPIVSATVSDFDQIWRDKALCALEVCEILPLLICYGGYRCTSVILTDDLLIQRTMLATTRISWPDVVRYESNGGWSKISSRSKTIRFSPFIADREGLMAEIERRAINSVNKGWGVEKPK